MRLFLLILAAINLMAQPYQCSPIGEQRLAAFLINGITTVEQARVTLLDNWNSLDAFYREASHNKAWFTGDMLSVTIQIPSTCDLPVIAARADAAARAQGVNLDLYTRHIYIGAFPCQWAGLGALGCGMTTPGGTTYGSVWLKGLGAWNHEMGHSFGMAHANTDLEYGDMTDAMGMGERPFNAPHRLQLGWLDTVQDVTANGTYLVSPLEIASFTPQVLRIQRSDGEQYYVSYRQPIGAHSVGYWPALTAGVSIHIWSPNVFWDPHPTRFVDTTPGSEYRFLDAPLSDGATYSDTANGVTITQLGHTPEFAAIAIHFGPSPPPPPPPPSEPVEISPTSATITPKGSVQFTANQDVTWSASWGSISISGLYKAPGANRDTLVTVRATSTTNPASTATSLVQIKRR